MTFKIKEKSVSVITSISFKDSNKEIIRKKRIAISAENIKTFKTAMCIGDVIKKAAAYLFATDAKNLELYIILNL